MACTSTSRLLTRTMLQSLRPCIQKTISLGIISPRCCMSLVSASTRLTTYGLQTCLPLQTGQAKFAYCGCIARTREAPSVSNHHIYNAARQFTSSTDDKNTEPKITLYQRLKAMYKDYWYVLLPVHLVTSAGWFGGFYYMASSGFDIVTLLESLNVSERLINPFRNGHATTGYLAISYALYKIATPLRYTVTLGGTTVSINYLKKWGYIKPVPSKDQLKAMYKGKKDSFKEKGQNLKDNMMQSLKPTASKKKNP